jgi:geranylgeranyl reductase family protein
MNKTYDVIISGCGPAGSLLGYYLAKDNIKTLIIEKEYFPRKKTCAGGIQHRVLKFIPFEITSLIENTIKGIYFSVRGENVFQKKYHEAFMYTIRREIFDPYLADRASDAGCDINFGEKVEGLNIAEGSAQVITSKSDYNAKIIVAADGARGCLFRHIISGKKINKIIGYEADINYSSGNNTVKDAEGRVFDLCDSVRLDFRGARKGYCWVFPKKTSMSCGMGAPWKEAAAVKSYLKKFLSGFCADYGNSDFNLDLSAHGIPVRNNDTPFCSHRLLAVGDAACFGDGFTGEGLYNAAKSAEYAAESIKNSLKASDFSFSDYFNNISNDIARDIKISLFLNRVFYGSFAFFYHFIEKNDSYFNAACRFLRGEKNYNDIAERLKILKL